MYVKRAIWMGAVFYFVSFIVGMIIAALLGVDFSTTKPPMLLWILALVTSIILSALFALWYFRHYKTKPSLKEGIYLGLTFIGIGLLIELILIIPYFAATGGMEQVLAYYAEPFLWLSLVLVIAAAGAVGWLKGKNKRAVSFD